MKMSFLCAATALIGLGACGDVEVVHYEERSVASPVMDAACVRAVAAETGNADVRAISAQSLGRSTRINLLVGGTGTWSCVVFEDGYVDTVEFTGSDGSDLA